MDLSNLLTSFQAARLQAQQTGIDSTYLLLGGLLIALITASVLITLLVWLRYLAAAALIITTAMNLLRWRKHHDGSE